MTIDEILGQLADGATLEGPHWTEPVKVLAAKANNPVLWLVAQAISEILPDGEKEKQLMQGLLNQREKLEQPKGLLF